MNYEALDFQDLVGLNSLSQKQLELHFGLYQKYVDNTNKVLEETAKLKQDDSVSTAMAETKRRLGWEWNGMRLHEYYFENLVKGGVDLDKSSELYKKIANDFGSFEAWQKDFINTASLRGIGWAILYFDLEYDRLLSVWVNEHDSGHLSGAVPLLVIDAWEHAYMVDYGTKRPDYLKAVVAEIDWDVVQDRFGEEYAEEHNHK